MILYGLAKLFDWFNLIESPAKKRMREWGYFD